LTGKIAMVAGSTGGLGEVAAVALAKAGADIAVSGRSAPDLEWVTAAIQGLGPPAGTGRNHYIPGFTGIGFYHWPDHLCRRRVDNLVIEYE
jgi:NAD(P)-dependent dehydrogenase (short-subunit alcohol dehydrogenase family)